MNLNFLKKTESKEEEKEEPQFMYTEEQLMARLRFFIGICLALTLTGIVFVVLYSIIFVTQPLNAISPIDQKFFELIIPIATFLTGTLSGIMLAGNDKDAQMKALEAANRPTPSSPIATSSPSMPRPFAPPPLSPMGPMRMMDDEPGRPMAPPPPPPPPPPGGFIPKPPPPPPRPVE